MNVDPQFFSSAAISMKEPDHSVGNHLGGDGFSFYFHLYFMLFLEMLPGKIQGVPFKK